MTPLVELRAVGFAYPRSPATAGPPFTLAGLDLALSRGEILGVIGPNSAGKTTLVRLLTRVRQPTTGEILLEGRSLRRLALAEVARRIAVVPQDVPAGLPFTVEQLVLMGRYAHAPHRYFESPDDHRVAARAMDATGVAGLAAEPVGQLSGGERQRVLLARALAQEPDVLVLDEPTAHLDLRHQVECASLLRRMNRERGMAIVLVSHDLNLAGELADRVLLLARGRTVRLGTPEEVLDDAVLTSVYECPVLVTPGASGRPLVQVVWPKAEDRPATPGTERG